MKKILFLVLSLIFCSDAFAALGARSATYTSGTVISSLDATANENVIRNYLTNGVDTYAAGSINNAAISSTAAITYSKLQNVSATSRVLGRTSAGAGVIEEMTFSTSAQDFSQDTFADDQVWVADSATAGTARTLPNCTDTSGNHLNYTQSTNTFSCGTTSSTSTTCVVGRFSRDTASASGTQVITTTFAPTSFVFFADQNGSAGEQSWGLDDRTNFFSFYLISSTLPSFDETTASSIFDFQSAGNTYAGNVSATTSTSFTINWTRTGTPTGTLFVGYKACP